MANTFSRGHGVVQWLRVTIVRATFAFMPVLGVAVPEMTHAEDNPQFQPILCEPDPNDTLVESAKCLDRFRELAARDGDVLRLNLENGKTKVYTGNRKGCDGHTGNEECVVFQLVSFYPSLQSFLVAQRFFECGYYELVSRQTGGIVKFSTVPEWSPNGKYLIGIDQNDLCDRDYDLAIWSAGDPPALELNRHNERFYENWTIIGWNGDDRIRLQVFTNSTEGSYDQDVEAVRSGNGWKLVWGKISNVISRKPASSQWPPTAPPADAPVPGADNR